MDLQERCQQLLQIENIESIPIEEILSISGELIDLSGDIGCIGGLKKAISWLESVEKRPLSAGQAATLHYFLANAWANLYTWRDLNTATTDNSDEKLHLKDEQPWDDNRVSQEIINLRKSIRLGDLEAGYSGILTQAYLNLGNIFSRVGRKVEAIPYWNKSLQLIPDYGMPLGNRGIGLMAYASTIQPLHDRIELVRQARSDLARAVDDSKVYPDAKRKFERSLTFAESFLKDINSDHHTFKYPSTWGESHDEQGYRKWSAENGLFLNFLNDIWNDVRVSEDKLLLPDIVTSLDATAIHWFGLFNQIKQEYITARFFLFNGMFNKSPKFVQSRNDLYNTLDYPIYSLDIEELKMAFRLAYSLFDKIAFFLNSYLDLGIKPGRVNFRSFWYSGRKSQNRTIRVKLCAQANWPLRGLYWLRKDLFENDMMNLLEPDAQEFVNIRRHLEHRYLKVHEYFSFFSGQNYQYDQFFDELALSILRTDFEQKALRLLKTIRAAIIYLVMAVFINEQYKKEQQSGIIGPIIVPLLDD